MKEAVDLEQVADCPPCSNPVEPGKIQGHTDIPISDRGIRQAEALRDRIARWDIGAVYTSDLLRTTETARIALGDRDVSVSPSKALREFGYGRWEGMTYKEIKEADPVLYAERLQRNEDFAPPGGESLQDVIGRTGDFVSGMKAAHPGDDTLLIVGHGGSLRVLLTCLLDLPALASWNFYLDSASLSIVDFYPGNAVIKLLNDTSHWGGEL